jgi:hypothetical protein
MEDASPRPARPGEDAAAPDPGQPLARLALARRKRRDAAIALPLAGVVLFVSPLLDLAAGAGRLADVPVAVIYIFGVWFALIACTARMAQRLMDDGGSG